MLEDLKKEAGMTLTENQALSYSSTDNFCLDLFATIGALRDATEEEIIKRFDRAFAESPDLAIRILFYARDIRGGLGERYVFRTIFHHLAKMYPETVRKNLGFVAEYGRFDDILVLIDTQLEKDMIELIDIQMKKDLEIINMNDGTEKIYISLLGKWLPSINASSDETKIKAKKIAKLLGLDYETYRKTLSLLRKHINILENYLREMDYSFDYSKQPSKAMYKYRKAFIRNDNYRYLEFIEAVKKGEKSLNTGTLYPYDVIRPLFPLNGEVSITAEEAEVMDTTWNSLPDFTSGEDALVVVDGSGSMYGGGSPLPIEVALSLGIYFAERNKGRFKNHFITFSTKPQVIKILGDNIVKKVQYAKSFNEVADTDIEKVFDLILKTALRNKLSQEDMPKTLYIISDMEFNSCTRNSSLTNFENAKKQYKKYHFKLPQVVFWNVQSRNLQQPVKSNEQGVLLVSGASPSVFKMLSFGMPTPKDYMLMVLNTERYNLIFA